MKIANLIFFFSSSVVFPDIRMRGNGQHQQTGLQQVVLALLCGACLLTHWWWRRDMATWSWKHNRYQEAEPGPSLCTVAISDACMTPGKHALLSPFAHGEKWHSCLSLRLSDWGKTIFSKENFCQKAEKYLVAIPFYLRKWVLLIPPVRTYDEFDSTNPCYTGR